MIPSNATPPTAIIDHVEGSRTGATRTPAGLFSPVIKLTLIAAPVVASYSPTLLPISSTTKSSLPDTARLSATSQFNPVMKFALIGAPVVAQHF